MDAAHGSQRCLLSSAAASVLQVAAIAGSGARGDRIPAPRDLTARPWEPPAEVADPAWAGDAEVGCRFASRCPAVMPECRRTPPPAYEPEPRARVACYLYRDAGEPR